MALVLADRVKVRTRTVGTGSFYLEQAFEGFQGFDAVGDGNETYYGIYDLIGNWEIGRGTYDSGTSELSRDNVLSSSNSNNIVNFPSGNKVLYSTLPASIATDVAASVPDSFKYIEVPGQGTLVADSSADTLTLRAGTGIAISTDPVTDEITITSTVSGGPGGGEIFSFSVGADDSTLRTISTTESIKFIGTGGVTTASDTEGNITIDGNLTNGSAGFFFSNITQQSTVGIFGDVHVRTTGTIDIYGESGAQVYIGRFTSGDVNLGRTGQTVNFSGSTSGIDYGDLNNLPTLFDGTYSSLTGTPTIPTTLTDLGIVDGSVGQVLTTNGAGGFSFTSVAGGGVTYTASAETTTGGANLRLTGSDASTDDVKFASGTGITVSRTDANTITITSSGSGLQSRSTANVTSSSLSPGSTDATKNIVGYKGYALLKIQTSAAAWVRLYSDAASRTADSSRTSGTDPDPGSGVIAEVITTGAETILMTPGVLGFSTESTPSTNIPVTITNESGSTTAITVTLTLLQLEG